MANTRFSRASVNRILNAATTLKNGTGGGAPAVVQDAAYPMSNLQVADRNSVWASGASPPNPLLIHYDLGSSQSIVLVGALGVRPASALAALTLTIGYRVANYSATQGDYTTLATWTAGQVKLDTAAVVSSTAARWWQFVIGAAPSSGINIGKLLLATSIDDLGIVYSPGARRRIITPRAMTQTIGGVPILTVLGAQHREFLLPFRGVTALRDTLTTIGTETSPFVYLDQDDFAQECLPSSEALEQMHAWGPTDVFDIELAIRSLP